MQPEPQEPQGVAQAHELSGTLDRFQALTNYMSSPSVRCLNGLSRLYEYADIVVTYSGAPLLGGGRSRKGIFNQGKIEK